MNKEDAAVISVKDRIQRWTSLGLTEEELFAIYSQIETLDDWYYTLYQFAQMHAGGYRRGICCFHGYFLVIYG
jgi:hypothetical protein